MAVKRSEEPSNPEPRQSNLSQPVQIIVVAAVLALLASVGYIYQLTQQATEGGAVGLTDGGFVSTLQADLAQALLLEQAIGEFENAVVLRKVTNLKITPFLDRYYPLLTKLAAQRPDETDRLVNQLFKPCEAIRRQLFATAQVSPEDWKSLIRLSKEEKMFLTKLEQDLSSGKLTSDSPAPSASDNKVWATIGWGIMAFALITTIFLIYLAFYSSKVERDINISFEAINNVQFGMKRQEGILASLLNSSEDAILLLDRKFKILGLNDRVTELYAKDGKKVEPGQQILNFVPIEEIEYFNSLYSQVLKGESFVKQEERKIAGQTVYFEVSYFPVRTRDKKIAGICSISRDVTERIVADREQQRQQQELLQMNRKLREGEEKLMANILELQETQLQRMKAQEELSYSKNLMDSVFNNADIMISAVNSAGQVIIWNNKAAELLGYSTEDALYKLSPLDFLTPSELEYEARYLSQEYNIRIEPGLATLSFLPERGQVYRRELMYRHRNGQVFPVELVVSPLKESDGQHTGLILIAQDITERIEQQNALLEANQNLMRSKEELQQALDELRSTQDSLVQSEKMASLGQLVAGVAHEVNTPIGIAVTAASYLEQSSTDFRQTLSTGALKKSELMEYVGQAAESSVMILKNLHRAAELIQSFKKVAVDQSKEDLSTVVLNDYIQDILNSLSAELRKSKVVYSLTGDTQLKVSTMTSSLSQVFINFVMNAIRHGFDQWEGERKLTIAFELYKQNKVRVLFQDSGKGIPPDVLPKIFDPFFTTKRGQGGSGLGLHIVFNIIKQKLRGDIFCESVVGKGATFTILLPQYLTVEEAKN
jgi:PAS domain S-box-containing protein